MLLKRFSTASSSSRTTIHRQWRKRTDSKGIHSRSGDNNSNKSIFNILNHQHNQQQHQHNSTDSDGHKRKEKRKSDIGEREEFCARAYSSSNSSFPRLANEEDDDNMQMFATTAGDGGGMMDWDLDVEWDKELDAQSANGSARKLKGKSLSELDDEILTLFANGSSEVDTNLFDVSFLMDMSKKKREDKNLKRQEQQQTRDELISQRLNTVVDVFDFKADPLMEKQKAFEARFVDRAAERYRKTVEGAVTRNQGASLPPAADVMVEWFMPVVKEIRKLQSSSVFSSPTEIDRNLRDVAPLLSLVDAEKMAVLTIHEVLSGTIRESEVALRDVAIRIGNAILAEGNMEQLRKNPRAMKLLNNNNGNKTSRIAHHINKLASFLLEDQPTWSKESILKFGTLLVDVTIKNADIPSQMQENAKMIPAFTHETIVRRGKSLGVIRGHEDLKKIIEDRHALRELVELKHLPMIVKPRPWVKHDVGGYVTQRSRIMRSKGSTLQNFVLQDADLKDICDGLNVLGDAEWIVHKQVLETVLRVWDEGGGLAEIPSRTDDVLPEKPSDIEDVDAIRKWQKQIQKTRQHNRDLHSLRCDLMYKLEVAKEFVEQPLYFPHNIDFRGRAYPIPPHLNHMGADLNRSLLMFKKSHPIGESGIFWLKIHTANLYGKDKFSFTDRVKFIDEHIDDIMDSADQPLDGKRWWIDSENPWQTLAACIELANCLRSPVPEEFPSSLPIQVDGSCNGLQHYAALGRDNLGALHVNLLPTEKPMDVYNGVLAVVIKHIDRAARRGDKIAQALQGKVYRSTIKQTVMTSVYGVTFVGAREQIARRLKEKKEIEEDMIYNCSIYLTNTTLKSLGEVFRSAQEIMDWLNEIAHLVSSVDEPVMWTTPLGLPVVQPYFAARRTQVKTVLQTVNLVDSKDQLSVSRPRQKSAFPPNYVHSLDASHMFLTAKACKEAGLEFASVHDSFWTHARHTEHMNRLLREQFIYLHSQPLLETLLESFQKRYPKINFPPIPRKGTLDLHRVKDAPYFFD